MAYSASSAVTAASGFTITGSVARNGIVTSINFQVHVDTAVNVSQFVVGTLQPAVRPKLMTAILARQTNQNAQVVSIDVRDNGDLFVTVTSASGGVYSPSGANIWIRALYMSC